MTDETTQLHYCVLTRLVVSKDIMLSLVRKWHKRYRHTHFCANILFSFQLPCMWRLTGSTLYNHYDKQSSEVKKFNIKH